MAELNEVASAVQTTDTTVTTTTETAAVTSEEVFVPTRTCTVFIIGLAQMLTGVGTTAVTPRIRRGSGVTGALVGDAIAIALAAAAGNNEQWLIFGRDTQENVDSVQYTLTLQQTGATGNGTIVQAGIVALVMP